MAAWNVPGSGREFRRSRAHWPVPARFATPWPSGSTAPGSDEEQGCLATARVPAQIPGVGPCPDPPDIAGESPTSGGVQTPRSPGVPAWAGKPEGRRQRDQTYGVVVVTGRSPERWRIGRDMSVQSEWM